MDPLQRLPPPNRCTNAACTAKLRPAKISRHTEFSTSHFNIIMASPLSFASHTPNHASHTITRPCKSFANHRTWPLTIPDSCLDTSKVRIDSTLYSLLTLFRRYSSDGDLIFTVAKDQLPSVWFAANGERLGTYTGHVGAVWTVDVDPSTTFLATGAADNTMRLWDVKTGKLLKTWEFPSSIRRVEFSPDGQYLLGVTEKRQNLPSSIVVYEIEADVEAEQSSEPYLTIISDDSRATVAGFSYLGKYIISGHEDGGVTQWDAQVCCYTA
jgi:WD40 repeat protein